MAQQEASVGDIGSGKRWVQTDDEIPAGDNPSLQEPSAAHDGQAPMDSGIDGSWNKGRIVGKTLVWRTGKETVLTEKTATSLSMEHGGVLYTANLQFGKLQWSDGDVWTKMEATGLQHHHHDDGNDSGSMTSMPPPFEEHANGRQAAPEGHVLAPGLPTLTSNYGRRVLRAKRTTPKLPEEIDVEVAKLSGESFKIKVTRTCTVGDAKKAIATALGFAGEEKRIGSDGSAYTKESFRKLYGEQDHRQDHVDNIWEHLMLSDERHYAFCLVDSCQLANSSSLSDGMPLFIGRTSIVGTDMVRLTLVFSSLGQ